MSQSRHILREVRWHRQCHSILHPVSKCSQSETILIQNAVVHFAKNRRDVNSDCRADRFGGRGRGQNTLFFFEVRGKRIAEDSAVGNGLI